MRVLAAAFAVLSLLPCCAPAQDPSGADWSRAPSDGPTSVPSDFVRFVREGDGGHLDTAITSYTKDGVEVVFYGAVHIADPTCYQTLNDRFTTCDVLLYELVGPEDYRPTKDREVGFNPIALLQNGLKRGLELSFQLDEIDYQADNFVHADMTPQEFQQSMAERGESLLSIMLDMMLKGQAMQLAKADADEGVAGSQADAAPDLVTAFQNGEGRHTLRMAFAEQLEQLELLSAGGEGSTLLEGRNEKCLSVLQRELPRGHRRIGIYYGAAHFPSMERRLVEDLGFRKVAHEWLVAWDCSKRADPKIDRELMKLRRRCRQELSVLATAGRDYRRSAGEPALPTVGELAGKTVDGKPAYAGPSTDPWGSEYRLQKRATGTRWQAVSAGPDRVFGSDDDLIEAEPRRGGLLGR